MANAYYMAKAPQKAEELIRKITDQLMVSLSFFNRFGDFASGEVEKIYNTLEFALQVAAEGGSTELAEDILKRVEDTIKG